MNLFLKTLIILTFALNFPLSAAQLRKKRPSESVAAEAMEQRKRLRPDLSPQGKDEKERKSEYNQQQIRLLEKLKIRCTSEQWSTKRIEILSALKADVHADDIFLDLYDFRSQQTQQKPLSHAVVNNDLHVALSLLKHNANPNQQSNRDWHSVLFEAQTPAMVQILLSYKADAQAAYDGTLFHQRDWVATYPRIEVRLTPALVLLFFKAGAPVNFIDSWNNQSALVKYLLEGGEDLKVYSLLVKLGCPLDIKTNERSPRPNKDFFEILREMGPAINSLLARDIMNTILEAQKEVESTAKEQHDGLESHLIQQLKISRALVSIISNYAQGGHVLPFSVCQALDHNEKQYPLDVDKLPAYDNPNCFWRLLGY